MKHYCLPILFLASVHISCCEVISVIPGSDQIVPMNSELNVTFVCNVSVDQNNSIGRLAIWEVEGRQIQSGSNPVRTSFESLGVFVEDDDDGLGVTTLSVTQQARLQYLEVGLMVRCTAFTQGTPPITQLGQTLFVRTYGRPEVPGNLSLVTSKTNPTHLMWDRPTNIPIGVSVNYTVTVSSSSSSFNDVFTLVDERQFSIGFLEKIFVDAEMCEAFMFYVMASVLDVDDSEPAVIMDTVPLSTNVTSIEKSLRVNFVDLGNGGDTIKANVGFQPVETCIQNFPVMNYTLIVDGRYGPIIPAVASITMVTGNLTGLVSDQRFQVGVMACSSITCRNSTVTVPLNTSDVQTGHVIFSDNNVFLSCSFAVNSEAKGCVFTFQVNQNGTGNEEFVVLQSMIGAGQQCNMTVNQRNGYTSITVLDLESDGVMLGHIPILVTTITVESDRYTELTGCIVQQNAVDIVTDSRSVSIAVPIVTVLLLIAVALVTTVIGIVYYKLRKRGKLLSDTPNTLYVDIASDNQKLLHKSQPSLSQRSNVPVMQSLPVTAHHMSINPQSSLPPLNLQSDHAPLSFSVPPERSAPIEVELHCDSIKLKVNKPALRAMARFHSMAKRHVEASEGSLTSQEEQSLLSLSNISRVHVSEEFKTMCCDLPPVEEGGEEEEELKSWGIISIPPLSPQLKPEQSAM